MKDKNIFKIYKKKLYLGTRCGMLGPSIPVLGALLSL